MENEVTPTCTLTFPLPMYEDEAIAAISAGRWQSAVRDMDQHLRNLAEYSDDDVLAGHAECVREQLREILDAHRLMLD